MSVFIYVNMFVCVYVSIYVPMYETTPKQCMDPLSYFSFQPVLHDWCKKDRGMCYPVCVMMHIKEPLLLIRMSSPCGGSWFPLSLSVWSFTICLTPYNRKQNVFSASLNKTFPSYPDNLTQDVLQNNLSAIKPVFVTPLNHIFCVV